MMIKEQKNQVGILNSFVPKGCIGNEWIKFSAKHLESKWQKKNILKLNQWQTSHKPVVWILTFYWQ